MNNGNINLFFGLQSSSCATSSLCDHGDDGDGGGVDVDGGDSYYSSSSSSSSVVAFAFVASPTSSSSSTTTTTTTTAISTRFSRRRRRRTPTTMTPPTPPTTPTTTKTAVMMMMTSSSSSSTMNDASENGNSRSGSSSITMKRRRRRRNKTTAGIVQSRIPSTKMRKQQERQEEEEEEGRTTTSLRSSSTSRSSGAAGNVTSMDMDNKNMMMMMKSLLSASIFILLDILFRRSFIRLNIRTFPSSLAGCGALFMTLLVLPKTVSDSIYHTILCPGANLLAKWLPVFFVPSLITLPLTDSLVGSSSGSSAAAAGMDLMKVAITIVGGFFFTLLTTSYSVLAIRKLILLLVSSSTSSNVVDVPPTTTTTTTSETEMITPTNAEDDEVVATTKMTTPKAVAAVKPFSSTLLYGLIGTSISSGFAASITSTVSSLPIWIQQLTGPLSSLCMLSCTLGTFVYGTRLPAKCTKIIHPLVTCTTLTWFFAKILGIITGGRDMKSILTSYRTKSLAVSVVGAGDILLFLLGPAVISLAISMYDKRTLMKENIIEIIMATIVSTFGGIFGTAYAVRILKIQNHTLRLCLLSRNITSPLAMSIAALVNADVSLAVSMVVITGLIGANFGSIALDTAGIKQQQQQHQKTKGSTTSADNDDDSTSTSTTAIPVARGLGIGAAAHGLGTAAFVNEMNAFPFAGLAMILTASASVITISIPLVRKLVIKIALG